jgi:DNA-binding FadR family transcriptional regulator
MRRRAPIYVEAQQRVRAYIREHSLRPGDRLPSEGELADYLGVSRGVVREATRSLQTLGVIEAQHGTGLFVSSFSFRPLIDQLPYGLADADTQFVEVLQVREALEVGLMAAAAALSTSDELAECERLAGLMDERESAGEEIVDVDREFHLLLYKGLGNPLVDHLIELFWELYRRLDHIPAPDTPIRHAPMHLAIVKALRAGDARAGVTAMQHHFDDVRRRAQALKHSDGDG